MINDMSEKVEDDRIKILSKVKAMIADRNQPAIDDYSELKDMVAKQTRILQNLMHHCLKPDDMSMAYDSTSKEVLPRVIDDNKQDHTLDSTHTGMTGSSNTGDDEVDGY